MPPHPLTNFEIEKYYLYYNYSRDNLPELISVEKTDGGIRNKPSRVLWYWNSLGCFLRSKNNDVIYFDSFGEEHIPK